MIELKRYTMWAGRAWPPGISKLLVAPQDVTVWPIVDNLTCGPIYGEPTWEQVHCVTFTSEAQREICDLLNARHDAAPSRIKEEE